VSSNGKQGQQQFDKIRGCAVMSGKLPARGDACVKTGSVDTDCDSVEYFPQI
jgi:hypothetical protein